MSRRRRRREKMWLLASNRPHSTKTEQLNPVCTESSGEDYPSEMSLKYPLEKSHFRVKCEFGDLSIGRTLNNFWQNWNHFDKISEISYICLGCHSIFPKAEFDTCLEVPLPLRWRIWGKQNYVSCEYMSHASKYLCLTFSLSKELIW